MKLPAYIVEVIFHLVLKNIQTSRQVRLLIYKCRYKTARKSSIVWLFCVFKFENAVIFKQILLAFWSNSSSVLKQGNATLWL